ncbi:unnamed protein product [Lampetra fluviatilis]
MEAPLLLVVRGGGASPREPQGPITAHTARVGVTFRSTTANRKTAFVIVYEASCLACPAGPETLSGGPSGMPGKAPGSGPLIETHRDP